MDPFYSYGFAFPVWNNVDATKSIIFGTKNHLTQNFIVNLGWVIGGSIALLFICWYQRRQEDKQELQQRIEEKKEHKQEKPSGKTAA
jgi:sensor c-di-GMP phosphodiesterase-like protein